LSEEYSFLRPSILPSLAKVASHNFSYGITDIAVFEIGKAYKKEGEEKVLGIAVAGGREKSWRSGKEGLINDFFYLKGIVESLFEALGIKGGFQPAQHPLLNPLCTAKVEIEGKEIGFIGEIGDELMRLYDIDKPLYLGEISVDRLREERKRIKIFSPLPKFPSIERDLSIIVKKDLTAERIVEIIKEISGNLLDDIFLFDVYEGKPVPEGERSLAFSLTFRAADRTLSSEEVDSLMSIIREALKQRLEAKIRE
jgi:phenylalanyl-tRNA synthetase beta chain